MQRTGRRAALAAAVLALACAAPAAAQRDTTAAPGPGHHARRSTANDRFIPCPGQDSAMALIAGRPPVRHRPQGMGTVTKVVDVTVPVGTVPTYTPPSIDGLVLRLDVDEHGVVTMVTLEHGSGDMELDQLFAEAARQQRFDPATESSFPVPGCALQRFGRRYTH